jgi:hypothetical protein
MGFRLISNLKITDIRRHLFILAAIFIVTRILCFLIVAPNWSDIPIYSRYSDSILDGQIPYKEFEAEYPPFALLLMVIPGFLAKFIGSYMVSYRLVMLLFDMGNIWLINKLAKNAAGHPGAIAFKPLLIYLIFSGLAFQLLYDRFDVAIAFMILLSVYFATIKNAWFGAYLMIWIAALAKIFPVILFPLFLITQAKNKRKKHEPVVDFALALLAFVGAIIISEFWFGSWWESVLSYHGGRGIQVESIFGMFASVAALFGVPYSINHNFGSFNIENSFTPFLATLSPFVLLAAIIFGYYLYYLILNYSKNKLQVNQALMSGILIVLLMFIIANKVISPQYLLWLYPFISLYYLNPKSEIYTMICWSIIAILTSILFPYYYPDMIMQKPMGVSLLILRNLLLLLTTVFLARNVLKNTESIR